MADATPHAHAARLPEAWEVTVPDVFGGSFRPSRIEATGARGVVRERVEPIVLMRLPNFGIEAADGMAEFEYLQPIVPPKPCDQWMPQAGPQAAERWLSTPFAGVLPTSIPLNIPAAPSIGDIHVRRAHNLARIPQPQLVERDLRAALNSTPAVSRREGTPEHLGSHAIFQTAANSPTAMLAPPAADFRHKLQAEPVESMAAPAAVSAVSMARPIAPVLPAIHAIASSQVLPIAEAVEGLAPAPVETMPTAPAMVPATIAGPLITLLPTIKAIIGQVLPEATAVEAPAPAPVETFPSVAALSPAACDFRPEVRFPTFARFQPADDGGALAAPVAAPGPVPVESMPAAAAYAPMQMAFPARVATQAFTPEVQAGFDVPKVAGPQPHVAEPPVPAPQPAVLEPVARISAQPSGAQPERPAPAIPHPGSFPLEYYCQRIASAPKSKLDPIETKVSIIRPAFSLRIAQLRVEDLLQTKPTRLVLPFEEIFSKKPAPKNGRRVNINTAGKIAAAVMVGLSLWTGMRLASLGRQTQQLQADVASSERVVAVGVSRERNFGNGPMGKVRRAIADRAATEMTDTFKAGMSAWGAEKGGFARGWKHDAKGYLSTGEMALFQPSLKFSDYRMEFYGQIEEKSLGWVVRAQDKKNYYAMKFTVIEPGLRPIIAMVHYEVVNGKAGHKIQTPLSVMVHNQKAIHVAVDVRGNRFTTTIDGEPVESWTDNTLAKGGVGFFSDSGERARLYWMKLSRNQDWLGRFCAYLSGDGQTQTAEVWGPGAPNGIPGPFEPQMPALALAAAGPFKKRKRRI